MTGMHGITTTDTMVTAGGGLIRMMSCTTLLLWVWVCWGWSLKWQYKLWMHLSWEKKWLRLPYNNVCIDQFHTITTSHYTVKMWIDLISNSCLVTASNKVKEQSWPLPNLWWLNLKMHVFETTQWIIALFPQLTDKLMPSIIGTPLFFQPISRVGKSFEIFSVSFYESPQTQQELSVDVKNCVKTVKKLHHFVHTNKILSTQL